MHLFDHRPPRAGRRRTIRGAGLLFALAAAAPSVALAQTQPSAPPTTLTIGEAVATARANNPTFLSRQNDLDVARWQTRAATADFLPSVNASTSFGYTQAGEQRVGAVGFGDRPDYYSSDYAVSASLEVTGSKMLQPTVARANQRATEQRISGEEANVVSNVEQQYLSVLQAQDNVIQSRLEVERTGEHVRLAQARLEVGAGTQLDVRRAEVQQGQAEIRLVQAENTLATATLLLGQLMGVPLEPRVQLTSQFDTFEPGWRTDDLVQRALRNNPNLLAARASADAAGTSVRQAQSAYLPRLTFSTGIRGSVFSAGNTDLLVSNELASREVQYLNCLDQNRIRGLANLPSLTCRNPADVVVADQIRADVLSQNPSWPFGYRRQPIGATVTLSLPLFTGLQRQVNVAQAQASVMDARYTVRAQELQLQTDVGTAIRNLETAYRSAQIQERVRATAAEELRLAQERFRFGAASSVEVTDAQTNLADTERAQIEAVYNFHKSLAALEALIGERLR